MMCHAWWPCFCSLLVSSKMSFESTRWESPAWQCLTVLAALRPWASAGQLPSMNMQEVSALPPRLAAVHYSTPGQILCLPFLEHVRSLLLIPVWSLRAFTWGQYSGWVVCTARRKNCVLKGILSWLSEACLQGDEAILFYVPLFCFYLIGRISHIGLLYYWKVTVYLKLFSEL